MAKKYGTVPAIAEILQELVEVHGWRVVRTKSSHWQCYSPDGKTIVWHSSTPSDYRATKNFKAELRRAGVKFK
jgi:predicted RNA binding protein YcfA (HicA-like mRNA interferase family)